VLFVQIADLTLVISVISPSDRADLTSLLTHSDRRSEVSTIHVEIGSNDLCSKSRCIVASNIWAVVAYTWSCTGHFWASAFSLQRISGRAIAGII